MRLRRLYGYSNLVIAGVLLLVAWALLTLLASRPALKHLFDLTPQARATVDVATKQLLAQVRDQDLKLEFHLFFRPLYSPPQNEQDRAWWEIDRSLQTLTRDLLRQYAYLGGDAVKVRDYDPDRQIQQTREQKERFAITSASSDNTDWIVVVLGGRHRKLSLELDLGDIQLPNIAPTPGIAQKAVPTLRDFRGEEALTSTIKSLMLSGTPIVYFLTGYGEASITSTLPDGYATLRAALLQYGFQVRELALRQQDAIPADASALALLEPKNEFSERESDLLMAYLKRGGRLFVDYAWFSIEDLNSDGGPLGRRLGFDLSREMVFEKQRSASSGEMLDGNPAVMNLNCLYNQQHPMTAPLAAANQVLSLKYGREFGKRGDTPKGVRLESVVSTGPQAWLGRSQMGPTGVPVFDYRAPTLPNALAPRSVGIVADVDGDQKDVTGHAVLLAGLAFNNLGWPLNRDLAMNIFNWMAERKVLVPVASDRYHARQVKISLEQVGNIEWLLVAAVPGLFLVLGLFVSWRRSRSR